MPDPTPPSFDYPRTADEWWEQAAYVAAVMPEWGPKDDAIGKILATNPPLALRHLGRKLYDYYGFHGTDTFYATLAKFIKERNRLALSMFNSVWNDAPDAPYIHGWTGWDRLCDLCSEGPSCLRSEPNDDAP